MLILASRSSARRALLDSVGLVYRAEPAPFDEEDAKWQARALSADAMAAFLAKGKARAVARIHPGALVIGADQTLETEAGDRIDQSATLSGVADTLRHLRGRKHRLIAHAVLMRGETQVWSGAECATLTMRALSDAQIDHYCATEGPNVLGCVGGYRIEGPGIALFDRIEGSHGAILGLPWLPLLLALRAAGVDPITPTDYPGSRA